jgi:uncharacterized protein (DUF1697 family)
VTVYVILLHGINVGGHNRVRMADLREALAETGLEAAVTYLQSGNLVLASALDAAEVARRVETTLQARFEVNTTALCFSREQWSRIVAANPFPNTASDPARLVVLFSDAPLTPEQHDRLNGAQRGDEAIAASAGATFLSLPDGQARSKLAATASALFKKGGTMRNWRTVLALKAMAEELTEAD